MTLDPDDLAAIEALMHRVVAEELDERTTYTRKPTTALPDPETLKTTT